MAMDKDKLFLKVWSDPKLFSKNFIKIINKAGEVVPFEWNEPQCYLWDNIDKYNVIGKSRQGGISTWVMSLCIWKAITQPYTTSVLYSHNDESTRNNWGKLKQMFDSVPDVLKPKLERNNRMEILLANGSSISCACLGRKEKGRGASITGFVWLSELAFVDNETAQKQLTAITQGLSASGKLIIESTSNGYSYHADLFMGARNKENVYKPFFFSYPDFASMFQDEYGQYWEIFRNTNGHYFTEDDRTAEEIELQAQDNRIDLKMLCWRRLKIATMGKDEFSQEFPLTFEESLLTTGTTVFDKQIIANNKVRLKGVKPLPKVSIVDISHILQGHLGKSLFFYEKPLSGHNYIISCDCSEGIKKDYHVAIVLDVDTKREVAMFRNNAIRPDTFADVINVLGRMYNNAYCIVELASAGHTVIEKLYYKLKYYNMHRHTTYDNYGKSVQKLGFDTNSKTKSMVIATCREYFEKGVIQINSEIILDEMLTYTCEDGKYNAKKGCHDDTIMALAIGCEIMKKPIKRKVM